MSTIGAGRSCGVALLIFVLLASSARLEAQAPAALGASGPSVTVDFPTPGTKTVTLKSCNSGGCTQSTRTVVVLPPWPELTGITVAPARLAVGRALFLRAAATGQPPLAVVWQILENGSTLATLHGASVIWQSAIAAPGPVTVRVTVSNGAGTATAERTVVFVGANGCGFVPLQPACRLVDLETSPPLPAGGSRLVAVGGQCGIPRNACAIAAHIAAPAAATTGDLWFSPGDDPWPLTSELPLQVGLVASNFGILPLSQDGGATLAAGLSAAAGSAAFLLDVAGYFAPRSAVAEPLAFAARLCPFGFCETAAGSPLFFTEAFSAPATAYRYDWTGSGAFDPPSPAPITEHRYSLPGIFTPVVEAITASTVETLRHPLPILVVAANPSAVPPAPTGLSARYVGQLSTSALDPTLAGPLWGYQVTVAAGPPNLLGYNAYLTEGTSAPRLAGAFVLPLTGNPPLPVVPQPAGVPVSLALTAVSSAGESVPSTPLRLPPPMAP